MIAESRDVLPAFVLLSALFGFEFQIIIAIALTTLLCGLQTPEAAELRRDLGSLRLPRLQDPDSIIQFDF